MVKAGTIPKMVTILTGANSFLLQRELRRVVDGFIVEHSDMGLERLDGEEVEYDRIREALESLPFLASKKLVVLRSPSSNKQFVENAEKLLTNLSETTDVILVEPKLDKRLTYYKFLKKATEFQEFNELDENGLSRWLVDTAKQQAANISQSDARFLVERVGINQQLLGNELQKLISYDPNVSRVTIELLVEATPQSTIFELLDAAFAGKVKQVANLYEQQRKLRVEPQAILAMISWQLHVLAVVKAAGDRDPNDIAKAAKLNPFVVRKSQGIARRLGGGELKQLIRDVLRLDVDLKSKSIDADDAIQNLLLNIAH